MNISGRASYTRKHKHLVDCSLKFDPWQDADDMVCSDLAQVKTGRCLLKLYLVASSPKFTAGAAWSSPTQAPGTGATSNKGHMHIKLLPDLKATDASASYLYTRSLKGPFSTSAHLVCTAAFVCSRRALEPSRIHVWPFLGGFE